MIFKTQRRTFLKQIAGVSCLAMMGPVAAASSMEFNKSSPGLTVLFQGDSITDGNRARNDDWNHVLGHGYAYLVASRLGYEKPASGFHFFNRGISGNTIADLESRWQKDTIDLKPVVLSLLAGINDVESFLNGNQAFTTTQFEKSYRQLLQQTVTLLPGIKLVLCEPFILPVGRVKERWDEYKEEMRLRRAVVARLSLEFDTVLVKFQDAFDKALSKAPADYWIWDGIHPMPAGHELMAREWIQQVGKKLQDFR